MPLENPAQVAYAWHPLSEGHSLHTAQAPSERPAAPPLAAAPSPALQCDSPARANLPVGNLQYGGQECLKGGCLGKRPAHRELLAFPTVLNLLIQGQTAGLKLCQGGLRLLHVVLELQPQQHT